MTIGGGVYIPLYPLGYAPLNNACQSKLLKQSFMEMGTRQASSGSPWTAKNRHKVIAKAKEGPRETVAVAERVATSQQSRHRRPRHHRCL